MKKRIFLLFCLLFCLLPSLAWAESTLPSGMVNPLPLKYPELATAPAPSWCNEGMRATYNVLASTSERERSENIEWNTGKPGYGLSQVDVVALEGGKAATYTLPYAPDQQGAMRQMTGFGSVVPAGCGDFWCNPAVLAKIPEQASDRFTVQRVTYTLGGEGYNAIRFDIRNDNFEMALVYDLETGLLLYHTVDYTSYTTNPQLQTIGSSGTHGMYELRNLRPVNIPWQDGEVPAWLVPGSALHYQGQTVMQVQGAAPSSTPMSVQVSILDTKRRYAELRIDTYTQEAMPTVPAPYIKTVSGIAQLLGNWVPAAAIALAPGDIDSDPDTGMVTSLLQSDEEGVIFQQTNQVDFRGLYHYDRSGRLLEMYNEYNPDVTTSTGFGSSRIIDVQLQGAG
jgi:hypothetical protein